MSTSQFPVICEVSIVLTDGKKFASLSGPRTNGHAPEKADFLRFIATGVIAAEEQGLPGLRLPTPTEFLEFVAEETFGQRIAIAGCEKSWQGFTQEELDSAVSDARKKKEREDESEMNSD
jgi:hypothetical protein